MGLRLHVVEATGREHSQPICRRQVRWDTARPVRPDMVKPAQKFSSAHGTAEVDEDMLRSYAKGTFESQQFEYNKVKLEHMCRAEKHMMDFNLHSEASKQFLALGLHAQGAGITTG